MPRANCKTGKRDTSDLKVLHRRADIGQGFTAVDYLFSVTGDEFVERKNILTEYCYTKDDTGYWCPAQKEWILPPHAKGTYSYRKSTETRQKLLCVAGPLAGQRVTTAEGYVAYNVAVNNRRKQQLQACIFVHESVLKG